MVESFPRQTLRFGPFELDVAGYELRRNGQSVHLERQPMDLLILLVERRGELVLRADIIPRLWSKDVFVDVETGVNTAVRKVRQALHDSPESPAFIETVSGKGYRFIGSVEAIGGAAREPSRVMLAVLPFENIGNDPDCEYLADGLTEETIATLGQIDYERLSVIGRTSTMSYKGSTKSLAAIGEELNVDYVMEGSIRGENGVLRITCKLSRASDQAQVWSASYDRQPTSMLGLQQELSLAIAEQTRVRLSPERLNALSRRQTRNADAYDLYLRGLRFWRELTPQTTRRAVDYYLSATDLDPDYALAWAGLAEAYTSGPINGDARPLDVWPRAREAAAHAIRAQPNLAEAQHVFGQVNWWLEWDWPIAETAFRRAVALDASNAWTHCMLGHLLSQSGRHDEASRLVGRGRELEPLSSLHHAMSSQVAFQARDYAAALEHARQAVIVDPEFWVGYMMRAQAHEQLGETDLAFDALALATRLSGGNSKPISLRGYLLGKLGQLADARALLKLMEDLSRNRYVPPYAMALVHAGLGDPDIVFDCLDRAHTAHDVHLIFLTVDSKWDPFRTDPRFDAFLARCDFMRSAESGR